jgi:uncharacterized protein (DUF2062 family)
MPFLWAYKGGPMTRALYVGSVVSLLPLYGVQIFVGALAAIAFRCNLPMVAALSLITNPLTSAPIYYGTYKLGRWLLEPAGVEGLSTAASLAPAFTVGGAVAGIAMGATFHVTQNAWQRQSKRHARAIQQLRQQTGAA